MGLGLWNSWIAATTLELAVFFAGIWVYLSVTRARHGIGRYGFWALLAVLFFGWVSTLSSSPPSDARLMAWFALSMWIFVSWAWWVDKHRETLA